MEEKIYNAICPRSREELKKRQRERDLAWAVFSHNLWVLARLPEAEEDGLLKTG